MSRTCFFCGLDLINGPKEKINSYYLFSCPNKWQVFVCVDCVGKEIDSPCTKNEMTKLKVIRGFHKYH